MHIEKCDFVSLSKEIYGNNTESLDDYEYILLQKNRYFENDIFIVQNKNNDSENRLGWIFPIDSIISNNHNYYNTPHYPIYAKIALGFLNSCDIEISNTENIHIIICKKERLQNKNINDINNLLYSLVKYGYYQYTDDIIQNSYINYYSNDYVSESRNTGKIIVHNVNIITHKMNYINNLFTKILIKENHYYLRFMLLYQIIELFIEEIFYKRLENYKTKKHNLGLIREKISDLTKEKLIINILFDELQISQKLDTDFDLLIKDFLKDFRDESYFKSEKDYKISNILYDVRNILVHNYFKQSSDDDLLKKIVDKIELTIIDLIEKSDSLFEK